MVLINKQKLAATIQYGIRKMKTQISNLVRGNGQVVGTPSAQRKEIALKVREENPENMLIEIRGQQFTLKADWSISRKSVHYIGEIPVSLYKELYCDLGLPKDPKAFIMIDTNCNVTVISNSKKSMWHYVAESEITIL